MEIGMVQNGYGVNIGAESTRSNSLGKVPENSKADNAAKCMDFLREKCEEILEKLRNGETEVSYQIGAESYTEKEWDKLLKKFDDIQEDVRRKMEERFKKLEEKEEEKRMMEMRAEE